MQHHRLICLGAFCVMIEENTSVGVKPMILMSLMYVLDDSKSIVIWKRTSEDDGISPGGRTETIRFIIARFILSDVGELCYNRENREN